MTVRAIKSHVLKVIEQDTERAVTDGVVKTALNARSLLQISIGDKNVPTTSGWVEILSSGPVSVVAALRSEVEPPTEIPVYLQTSASGLIQMLTGAMTIAPNTVISAAEN